MLVSTVLHLVGVFGSAFAPNYVSFVILRFIVGMSNMGLFMSMFVIGNVLLFIGLLLFSKCGSLISFLMCVSIK